MPENAKRGIARPAAARVRSERRVIIVVIIVTAAEMAKQQTDGEHRPAVT